MIKQQSNKSLYRAFMETFYRFSDFFQVHSFTRQCSAHIRKQEMAVLSLVYNPQLDPSLISAKISIDKPLLSLEVKEQPLVDETVIEKV